VSDSAVRISQHVSGPYTRRVKPNLSSYFGLFVHGMLISFIKEVKMFFFFIFTFNNNAFQYAQNLPLWVVIFTNSLYLVIISPVCLLLFGFSSTGWW